MAMDHDQTDVMHYKKTRRTVHARECVINRYPTWILQYKLISSRKSVYALFVRMVIIANTRQTDRHKCRNPGVKKLGGIHIFKLITIRIIGTQPIYCMNRNKLGVEMLRFVN